MQRNLGSRNSTRQTLFELERFHRFVGVKLNGQPLDEAMAEIRRDILGSNDVLVLRGQSGCRN